MLLDTAAAPSLLLQLQLLLMLAFHRPLKAETVEKQQFGMLAAGWRAPHRHVSLMQATGERPWTALSLEHHARHQQ